MSMGSSRPTNPYQLLSPPSIRFSAPPTPIDTLDPEAESGWWYTYPSENISQLGLLFLILYMEQ